VSDVCENPRHPALPYTITLRYGATESPIENHRFPVRSLAEAEAAQIREHGLWASPWPSHLRPLRHSAAR
jgi:hypothetical protein